MSSVFSLLQPSKKTSTKVAIDGINNGGLKVDRGLKVGLSSASRAAAAVPCCGLTANILFHSKQLGRLTRKLASPIVSRKSSLAASSQAHKLTSSQAGRESCCCCAALASPQAPPSAGQSSAERWWVLAGVPAQADQRGNVVLDGNAGL